MKKRRRKKRRRERCFERQDGLCFYCSKPMEPRSSRQWHHCRNACTLDHLYPVALGFDRKDLNSVAACRRCNGAKGDRLPTDDEVERYIRIYGQNPVGLTRQGMLIIDRAIEARGDIIVLLNDEA